MPLQLSMNYMPLRLPIFSMDHVFSFYRTVFISEKKSGRFAIQIANGQHFFVKIIESQSC